MLGELRELYQEVILDHGKHPRNFRHPEDANRRAHGHNPICGDTLVVYLRLDEGEAIQDIAFQGKGCAISIASASLMTEILRGKRLAEAERLFSAFHRLCTEDNFEISDADDVDPEELERLQVLAGVREFPIRVKCATLAWHTMKAAVEGEEDVSTE